MDPRVPADFLVSGHALVWQFMAKALPLLLAEKGT